MKLVINSSFEARQVVKAALKIRGRSSVAFSVKQMRNPFSGAVSYSVNVKTPETVIRQSGSNIPTSFYCESKEWADILTDLYNDLRAHYVNVSN